MVVAPIAVRKGFVPVLRCECGQPSCKETLPAVAESYRGTVGRLIVMPGHVTAHVVVRAADRFFVVEPARRVK